MRSSLSSQKTIFLSEKFLLTGGSVKWVPLLQIFVHTLPTRYHLFANTTHVKLFSDDTSFVNIYWLSKTFKPSSFNNSVSLISGIPINVLGSSPSSFSNRQMPNPSLLKLPAHL